MMKNKKFCAFILSHGRADNVKTYPMLREQGYTGPIYIVVDDEDGELEEYKKRYGDEVVVFSKDEAAKITDAMDNFGDRRTPLYARNYLWTIAANLGIEYFIELDDDYSEIIFKFDKTRNFVGRLQTKALDAIFDAHVDFLRKTPTTVIAFAQGGEFIGGPHGIFGKKIFLRRKTMNSFICSVKKPFYFYGTMNDDVNSYLRDGGWGMLHFTNNMLCVQQGATQQNKGGLTELYLDKGTYWKSFYSVMIAPSAVKISTLGPNDPRIHHRISWVKAVPKILDEKWKKGGAGKRGKTAAR